MAGFTAFFSINADNAGEPGEALVTIDMAGITTTPQVLTAQVTQETILAPGTLYWLVGGTSIGQVNWNLGDMAFGVAAYRVQKGEWDVFSRRNVSAFAILGSPVPGPGTPPIADADGPYVIYVGDTLMLDASGSTDADGDITSYMWDLDNDNIFETDADTEAVITIGYDYLESLGLITGGPYDIHLQVTDDEENSDTDDTILTIIHPPMIEVAVDIKPRSCPNPVNVKSQGVLPVAILGSDTFDVSAIVVASVRLAGVGPIRNNTEDVAGPIAEPNECDCTTASPDGFPDLTLKFKMQDIMEAIGEVSHDDVVTLLLTGVLTDETPIEGSDCVLIRGKFKPINKADVNEDGVVDAVDLHIVAENWLQSSVIED